MPLVLDRRHLLLLFITLTAFVLHAHAGQGFTNGLAIIDAPSPDSPGHAGSALPIAIDVSGDGQLNFPDVSNPASTAATHFSLLEIYLVSADTSLNLTVSNGTQLLTQEPGSTVKHLNWIVPDCIPKGDYNLTFYETSIFQGQPYFIITPVPIPIQNSNPSNTPCSQTTGVTVNSLQGQPQAQSPLSQPIFPAGGQFSSTSSGPAFVTITLSGPLPFPAPSTVTLTPSASPTTVFVVSMTTETVTTTGPSGFLTETLTETAWSSTLAVTQNTDGFFPVNAGSSPHRMEIGILFCVSVTVGFWTLLA
ncbi:hypothetical protein GYMLUDRAFT_66351 [Collybiopsis luxurians FD-317 M1]|nr:hypothetical protein GYMLUDRAFT_66351 [Collybiopsis luxurians FD-317 M1]